jgi:sulfur-carrier protein
LKIKILFFGQIADITGMQEMTFQAEDTDTLLKSLQTKFPELSSMQFSVAVNKNIINDNTILANNDTVAILPPFSGG